VVTREIKGAALVGLVLLAVAVWVATRPSRRLMDASPH
jgi:hypothetical protein